MEWCASRRRRGSKLLRKDFLAASQPIYRMESPYLVYCQSGVHTLVTVRFGKFEFLITLSYQTDSIPATMGRAEDLGCQQGVDIHEPLSGCCIYLYHASRGSARLMICRGNTRVKHLFDAKEMQTRSSHPHSKPCTMGLRRTRFDQDRRRYRG